MFFTISWLIKIYSSFQKLIHTAKQMQYTLERILSHFWPHSMSERDSSDHTVSVVIVVVVVVGVNFFSISSSSLKPLHRFALNLVWMFLGWTPTKFVKIRVLPLFSMELWVILCNFWPILKKSSIKPLTRNHSYLVWRGPRGSSF